MAKNVQTQVAQRGGSPGSSRSKRQEILASAIDHFGRDGFEYTKWADIAADVGLGSTALYHSFESKLHCLFEIHGDAVEAERERFERLTADHSEFRPALVRLLNGLFDLSEHDVLRNRCSLLRRASSPSRANRRGRRRHRA